MKVAVSVLTTLLCLSSSVYGRRKVPFSENPQKLKHSGCLTDCDEHELPADSVFYAYNGKLPSDVPKQGGFGEEIWGGYVGTYETTDSPEWFRRVYKSMCDGTTVLDYEKNKDTFAITIHTQVNDVCLEQGKFCVRSKLGSCHSCARFECQNVKWIPNQGDLYNDFFEGNPNTRVF